MVQWWAFVQSYSAILKHYLIRIEMPVSIFIIKTYETLGAPLQAALCPVTLPQASAPVS